MHKLMLLTPFKYCCSIFLICACQSHLPTPTEEKSTAPALQRIVTITPKNTTQEKHPESVLAEISESKSLLAEFLIYARQTSVLSDENIADEISLIVEMRKTTEAAILDLKLAYLLSRQPRDVDNIEQTMTILERLKDNSEIHEDYRLMSGFMIQTLKEQRDGAKRLIKLESDVNRLTRKLDELTDIELRINEREPIENENSESPAP